MNKNVKTLVAVALVALSAGSAVFAEAKAKVSESVKIEYVTGVRETICGKIKVTKDGYKINVNDGRVYNLTLKEGDVEMEAAVKIRKNKLIIVTGCSDAEGNFAVEKIGGDSNTAPDK